LRIRRIEFLILAFDERGFDKLALEVSVFGEMAFRGLGILEKGFREFKFDELTCNPNLVRTGNLYLLSVRGLLRLGEKLVLSCAKGGGSLGAILIL